MEQFLHTSETGKPVGKKVQFNYTEAQATQVDELVQAAAPSGGFNSVVPTASWWSSMLQLMLPMALFLGVMWWLVGRMSGGRGGAMGFGRSKAKVGQKEMPDVTFDDVAGEDEAVEELEVPLSYACYSSYPLISITTVICLLPKSATEKHCFFREVKSQCKKNDKIRCYLE